MFVGSWFSGAVVEHYTQHASDGAVTYDWHGIWIVAAVASAIGNIMKVDPSRSSAPIIGAGARRAAARLADIAAANPIPAEARSRFTSRHVKRAMARQAAKMVKALGRRQHPAKPKRKTRNV